MNFDCIFLANQENDQSNLYLMVYEIMNKKYVIVFLNELYWLCLLKNILKVVVKIKQNIITP